MTLKTLYIELYYGEYSAQKGIEKINKYIEKTKILT